MSSKADNVLAILQQTLASCSKLIEEGDYSEFQQSIAELVNFLNSVSDSVIEQELEENETSQNVAVEVLTHIHQYIASPALKQEIVDALAFELPKAVARFACASTQSLEIAENVVDLFVERCNPRDMLSILCEAIGSPSELFVFPGYFIPLLSGLMKGLHARAIHLLNRSVSDKITLHTLELPMLCSLFSQLCTLYFFILIQRRHYAQVKTAVPVILNALKAMCSKSDDADIDCEKLFRKATGIAYSIREICVKLEGEDNKKLHALLGLYVLQIMAFVSIGMASNLSRCLPIVLELSGFLPQCELSYIGLITGREVDMISKLVCGDDNEDGIECFSQVKLGAAVAVIWGYKASYVAIATEADLPPVIVELRQNWTRRWEAIDMLRYIFSSADLSWELKEHGIRFLLCIMDGIVSHSFNDHVDYLMYMPTFYTSLQSIEMVIMYASSSFLRKNAFISFRKVLADIPTSVRFDVIRALIKNSDSSSMIGILLDCIKEEMRIMKLERNSSADVVLNSEHSQSTSFWNPSVLELVEEVLKPPEGGPPYLPEFSDAVLSALNLYRFILITESTGNSNCTGILSKDKLQKVYNECLLPLRTLLSASGSVIQKMNGELASDITCALNPVELVLYRCIELVEEKLKNS